MDDRQIIELYWARSEAAVSETAGKYGRYCHYIAYNILHSDGDSDECVNDVYLSAWNSIPPHRPTALRIFLGRLTRNISLNRYKRLTAKKRGGGQVPAALDELGECVPSSADTESIASDIVLAGALNRFLAALRPEQRKIFVRRYWYFSSIREIAGEYDLGESNVKMSLLRSRRELKRILEEEGIGL